VIDVSSLLGIFDAAAWTALAPLLGLALGAMLVLLAGLTPLGKGGRGALVGATLLVSAVLHARVLFADSVPGAVLGGSFGADRTTAMWGLIFLVGVGVAWLFSRNYYDQDASHQNEHDVLMLASAIGMSLMAGARDLIVFFIGLELLSIPLYALAAFRRNRAKSVEAGLKYFLLGAFAAGFYLYGAALLYAVSGTLSLDVFADDARRALILESPMALVGLAMLAASLFFKVSVFPFHLWVPDVYEGSPTPVAGLMATGTKAAAFAFLLNLLVALPSSTATSLALIALITMALGNLGALVQADVKRMLAYSGVAHAGVVLLGVAGAVAGDPQSGGALEASLFYMAAYVATAGGAFGVLALLESDGERMTTLAGLRGLGQRRPYLAAALTVFMLSLGGIPATGGFLGKYLVFSVAVRAHLVPAAVVGVLLSVVALGYYLRVIIALWMEAPGDDSPLASTKPIALPATLASAACVALVLGMGLLPSWFLANM
jgi:NADH-quinone oxidoreductase subunit N